MADIQTILNTIRNAVYGKHVRQAIVDAIQQCYADTSEGVTPVISISRVASATRVTITVGASSKFFDVPDGVSPAVNSVSLAEDMLDTNLVYIYTGSEEGYIAGHFYYYDPLEDIWIDGGMYQSSVGSISVLTDVVLENLSNGQLLSYDSISGKWKNVTISGGSIQVDSSISSTSENPVQNKAIYSALQGKANVSDIPTTSSTISAGGTNPVNSIAVIAYINSLDASNTSY